MKSPGVPSGPTVVPLLEVGTAPLQPSPLLPPVAAQAVALVVLQASEVDWPTCTVPGVAVSAVTAAGGVAAVTVNVADEGALAPPAPVQLNVYV